MLNSDSEQKELIESITPRPRKLCDMMKQEGQFYISQVYFREGKKIFVFRNLLNRVEVNHLNHEITSTICIQCKFQSYKV